jgi:hypothetical protein
MPPSLDGETEMPDQTMSVSSTSFDSHWAAFDNA